MSESTISVEAIRWRIVKKTQTEEGTGTAWSRRPILLDETLLEPDSPQVLIVDTGSQNPSLEGFVGANPGNAVRLEPESDGAGNLQASIDELLKLTRDATVGEEYHFKLWIRAGALHRQIGGVLLIVRTGGKCLWCDFLTCVPDAILQHIIDNHQEDLFRPLSYAETRRQVPGLPEEIYKCLVPQCSFYAHSDNVALSRTSLMDAHFREQHPDARLNWRIVTDAEEVKRHHLEDLPLIDECILCEEKLTIHDSGRREDHIMKRHRRELLQICVSPVF